MSDVAVPLLRTSERNDFRRCPWMWEQSWRNGLAPIHPPTWSWFGTAIHRALEVRYPPGRKRGSLNDTVAAFEIACGQAKARVYHRETEDSELEFTNAVELGRLMLAGYVMHYGLDEEWECIHTEQPFQIDVADPDDPSKVLVVYAGTWDALMRHLPTGQLWLWDHKTAASFGNFKWLGINDQAGSYLWVAKEVLVHKGILKKKDLIEGIIFNYLKKIPPDSRETNALGEALNKDGSISKVQPAPRFHREQSWRTPQQNVAQANRVQQEAQVMALMRSGVLPIYKNPTADCNRCVFFDMCELHEQGDDYQGFAEGMFAVRDPYRDHREAMEATGIEIPLKKKKVKDGR